VNLIPLTPPVFRTRYPHKSLLPHVHGVGNQDSVCMMEGAPRRKVKRAVMRDGGFVQ
jgi:hypothetical protein